MIDEIFIVMKRKLFLFVLIVSAANLLGQETEMLIDTSYHAYWDSFLEEWTEYKSVYSYDSLGNPGSGS